MYVEIHREELHDKVALSVYQRMEHEGMRQSAECPESKWHLDFVWYVPGVVHARCTTWVLGVPPNSHSLINCFHFRDHSEERLRSD